MRRRRMPKSTLSRNRGARHVFHEVLRESAWVDVSMCRQALRDADTVADPVALEDIARHLLAAAVILQETGIGNRNLPPPTICPT